MFKSIKQHCVRDCLKTETFPVCVLYDSQMCPEWMPAPNGPLWRLNSAAILGRAGRTHANIYLHVYQKYFYNNFRNVKALYFLYIQNNCSSIVRLALFIGPFFPHKYGVAVSPNYIFVYIYSLNTSEIINNYFNTYIIFIFILIIDIKY